MTFRSMVWVLLAGTALLFGCGAEEKETVVELNDLEDKFSYSYGLNLGQNFRLQETSVDQDAFLKGLEDGLSGNTPLLTAAEIEEVKVAFQEDVMARAQARSEERARKNKEAGEAFLAENAEKEEVNVSESGLQYTIIEEGDVSGASPGPSDRVVVNYTGTLIDGTEFDSTARRGTPATFIVGEIIPGWTEALQLMKPGAKWKLFLPAELAYGEQQAGPLIAPNSVLIFEVELLEVNPPAEEDAAAAE